MLKFALKMLASRDEMLILGDQRLKFEALMKIFTTFLLVYLCFGFSAWAGTDCSSLPGHAELKQALTEARKKDNGGLNLEMWGSIVDRSGIVCAVVYTGENESAQWPGSRVIAAQKANTANAFSLKSQAFATANLYSGVQPGGFMFGIQESNPIDVALAYKGSASSFGSASDPMVGGRIGGINVFGGGLALYNSAGEIVGGLGVSGDTSCADHNIAWHVRKSLKLDFVPGGVSPDKNDNILYDISSGKSASGFGHPECVGTEAKVARTLPPTAKVEGKK